jgi:hypothetical protein
MPWRLTRSRTKDWWAARKNWTPTYRCNKNEVDTPFILIYILIWICYPTKLMNLSRMEGWQKQRIRAEGRRVL